MALLESPPTNEPQIRLLFCFICKSLEELPDYEGRPEHDDLLEILISRHHFPSGEAHTGHLLKVPMAHWSVPSTRDEIIRQIKTGSGGIDELDAGFYDTRATFAEDALTCYSQHQRPKGQCPDYGSSSKALVPDTRAERKEVGLPSPAKAAPTTYLCQFCPVHVYNVTRASQEKGLYK